MPGDQGQSAAVPEGGGGSELPALSPGGPGDPEEGEGASGTPEQSSARRRHKELVMEEMLDNEMAILAPLQEGMQALPSEEVANEGARALSGLGDPSAGEPGRAPGAGAGGGDLLGER